MMNRAAIFALMIAALATTPAEARRHHVHVLHRPVSPFTVTNDLDDPVQAALAAEDKGHRVIVVFDIDNTLLTMPQDLGSDTWYNWQRVEHPDDFKGVLSNSDLLLTLGHMVPTQPDVGALIQSLQGAHIPVFALSARSGGLRGATEAALASAGIDLSEAPECGAPLCTRRGQLYDTQIRAALRRMHMTVPAAPFRPVTVSDGLMMVSGQDKGVMLHLLLASLKARYDDVYFVDDTQANIDAVEAAAPIMPATVHAYSYRRLWKNAADFMADPARQQRSDADLAKLKAGICAAIDANTCNVK